MIAKPRIVNLRWYPECQTEQDDDTTFDFEIWNEDSELDLSIHCIVFELLPASGTKVVPASVSSLEYKRPGGPVVKVVYTCQGDQFGVSTIVVPVGQSVKLNGNLKTSTRPGVVYPFPFIMKVSLNWTIVPRMFDKESTTTIEKTIEPD